MWHNTLIIYACQDSLQNAEPHWAVLPPFQVDYAALSAHTDAKGILQIIQQVAAASVMLVHGEPDKMAFMSDKIQRSLNIPCFMPANGEEVVVDSGKAHILPVSAQLLRQLPASLQELQQPGPVQWAGTGTAGQAPGSSGRGMCSVGEAAAGWLQQGDVGQLAGAAMRLAGLAPPGSTTGTTAGVNQAPGDQQQQQQLLQVHGTAAAARAAQLAPWLELLAAAAQDVRKQHQQQQQQQLRQPDSSMSSSALMRDSQQVANSPAATADVQSDVLGSLRQGVSGMGPGALQSCLVSVAQDLQQQAQLEQQAVLVDGVLLVHHPPAAAEGPPLQPAASVEQVPRQQQQRIQLELLPAKAAASRLQMQQHHIKLSCRLQLPPSVLQVQEQQGQAAVPPAQPHTGDDADQGSRPNNLDAASFIAAALKSGLPAHLAQLVEVSMMQLSIRSIKFEHEEGASGKGCWKCSWSLADDALAQQCVALVKQHL